MRSFHLVVGLAAVVVVPLIACGDESNPGAPQPDAGGDDVFVPGDDGGSTGDAQPDATPKTGMTVRVRHGGAPFPMIRVLFHDTAGAVTGSFTTDTNGVVSAPTAPSQVTVLTRHIVTYTAVAEGDELVVDDPGSIEAPTVGYSVTLPGAFNGATYYQASSGDCQYGVNDSASPVSMPMYKACLAPGSGTLAILAWAEDNSGTPIAYAFKKGNANPTALKTPVSIGGAWADATDVLVTASNLPGGTSSATFVMYGEARPFEVLLPSGTLSGGDLKFKTASGFSDAIQANAVVQNGPSEQLVGLRQAPAAQVALDFSKALPAITDASVKDATTKRPEATWTSASPIVGADGALVTMSWSVELGPDDTETRAWSFVVPPTATSVKAPELPADFLNGPTGTVEVSFVGFGESDLLPDYAKFKTLPFDVGNGIVVKRALPANGSLRTTSHGSPLVMNN